MKKKLQQITDDTLKELLNDEIVLPSSYFQCFDKNAKKIEIEIKDESFEKEISKLLSEEVQEMNAYANQIMKKMKSATNMAVKATEAIDAKDGKILNNLYEQMNDLQKELEKITNKVYVDHLTKAKNRKWLTHSYLEDMKFKSKTICVLIDINDYEYIDNNYNKLVADNVLVFICDYFMNTLNDEKIKFEIVRFLNNKFLIFIDDNSLEEVEGIVININKVLSSKILKSKKGIIIKPVFKYCVKEVKKGATFKSVLEELI